MDLDAAASGGLIVALPFGACVGWWSGRSLRAVVVVALLGVLVPYLVIGGPASAPAEASNAFLRWSYAGWACGLLAGVVSAALAATRGATPGDPDG
jgi:hypothetical protein